MEHLRERSERNQRQPVANGRAPKTAQTGRSATGGNPRQPFCSKFSRDFDAIFSSEGIEIINTPIRAPKANAIAERFVRTARSECLDWLLIVNRRHLERALRIFVDHYNSHRPHRSLELTPPDRDAAKLHVVRSPAAGIERRDRLGGLIHEYSLAA